MSTANGTVSRPKSLCSPGLKRLLLRLGIADEKQIARLEAKEPEAKIIRALALEFEIDEETVLRKVSQDLGMPVVSLREPTVIQKMRQAKLADKIDNSVACSNRCLPLYRAGEEIVFAFADPLDGEAKRELEFSTGERVRVAFARELDIAYFLSKMASSQFAEGALADLKTDIPSPLSFDDSEDNPEAAFGSEESGSESAPIIQLVSKILSDALEQKASDIHLEPTVEALDVRLRIDGVMSPQFYIPKKLQSYVITRLKILAGMDITEKRRPQDGRFTIRTTSAGRADARISTMPTPLGEKVVIRILDSGAAQRSLDVLTMSPELLSQFKEVLRAREGMVIVTGPTGSGKSTTLYAALNHLHQGTTNIITVEDPIEYRLDGVTQIQVDAKVGMTFANVLRSVLRQDPDIILIGEIRDVDTAAVGFQAAQTGHLVLATLHTNSAAAAVVRLRDLGIEPFIIASSLHAVLAQRLVRKLCPVCAKAVSDETAERLRALGVRPERARDAGGCRECEYLGYRGRLGVYSLLVADQAVKELIRVGASEAEVENCARRNGMADLFSAGRLLVEQGLTSFEEIERVLGKTPTAGEDSLTAPSFETESISQTPAVDSLEELLGSFVEGAEQAYRQVSGSEGSCTHRLLFVDDDDDLRSVMAHKLVSAGFEVIEARSASEALNWLEQFTPDLVLTDFVMPGMNGREFLKEMRSRTALDKVPVVVLTSSDSETNEASLIQAGASDFVSKGASTAVLLARIKRLIQPPSRK